MGHLRNSVLHGNIWSGDHGPNCRVGAHMAHICTAAFPLLRGSHRTIGNMHMLFVQLCVCVCVSPRKKKKETPNQKNQQQISSELVRLHGTIGYGRFATEDLESTIRNNPCQTYLLQSPAEKWGETEGSRQSTTFIVGILLTSLDLNCSLEAKPTLVSFIPLKSQA